MGRQCRRPFPAEWILSRRSKRWRLLAGRSRWRRVSCRKASTPSGSIKTKFTTAIAFPTRKHARGNMAAKPRGESAAAKRLASWGFNTLGSWSDEAVASAGAVTAGPVTPNLDLGMSFAWPKNDQTRGEPEQDFPMCSIRNSTVTSVAGARELCAKPQRRAGHHRLVHR